MSHPENAGEEVAAGLRKVLNSHGYGFHYAVLRRALELASQRSSKWEYEEAEFPVRAGPHETRVDLIFRNRARYNPHEKGPFVLVCECKRANPSISNWCFVQAPFRSSNPNSAKLVVETLMRTGSGTFAHGDVLPERGIAYHVGLELKTEERGDSEGKKRGQIEEAATQVMKGVNGLAEVFAKGTLLREDEPTRLLPVVFTTARLYVSDARLHATDIETGNLRPEEVNARAVNWLWFQYHQSPSLRHSRPIYNDQSARDIKETLEVEYSRSIAIVSASGIDEFLTREWM